MFSIFDTRSSTNPQYYDVIIGTNNVEDVSDNAQYFSVSEVITHPQYDFAASRYDIGLLRLQTNATITDYVRTVCIPSADMASDFPAGTMCTVSGWGSLSGSEGKWGRGGGRFLHWHGIRICACLLRFFFAQFGIAIVGFLSEK